MCIKNFVYYSGHNGKFGFIPRKSIEFSFKLYFSRLHFRFKFNSFTFPAKTLIDLLDKFCMICFFISFASQILIKHFFVVFRLYINFFLLLLTKTSNQILNFSERNRKKTFFLLEQGLPNVQLYSHFSLPLKFIV